MKRRMSMAINEPISCRTPCHNSSQGICPGLSTVKKAAEHDMLSPSTCHRTEGRLTALGTGILAVQVRTRSLDGKISTLFLDKFLDLQ